MVKAEAVIFDVDGTLCDVSSVRHYVTGEVKNFDAFHRASAFCPPHQWVVDEAIKQNEIGRKVIVATGRDRKYAQLTFNWLIDVGVPFHGLYTRNFGDRRKDAVVKLEMLHRFRELYTVVHAWDDNPSIIEVWQSEGIPVTVVPGWDEQ